MITKEQLFLELLKDGWLWFVDFSRSEAFVSETFNHAEAMVIAVERIIEYKESGHIDVERRHSEYWILRSKYPMRWWRVNSSSGQDSVRHQIDVTNIKVCRMLEEWHQKKL